MNFLWYIILSAVISSASARILDALEDNACEHISSCSSCVAHESCSWCVMKSGCTAQDCGNDNAIYPAFSLALLAGPEYCPRIASTNEVFLKDGAEERVEVKVTQLHLLMAYTQWKCKFDLEGNVTIVNATILDDTVTCSAVLFNNDEAGKTVSGKVSVLWDHHKALDGFMPLLIF
ncbi:hypothetical protein NE865_01402 [Phthorimaea operculella]|nr:hypothetical protein NE865_01402 [Phthorimaea operculella]